MSRPTKALINLDALRNNFRLAQALAPSSQTMPMVKANAYGHGMVPVATALADLAPAFGVACIEEALELRKAGITQPILLLEGTFSAEEVAIATLKNIWMMVENHPQKEAIINTELPMSVYVWLGLDSGMHRLGFQPSDIADVYGQLLNSRNVHKRGNIAGAGNVPPQNGSAGLTASSRIQTCASVQHHFRQTLTTRQCDKLHTRAITSIILYGQLTNGRFEINVICRCDHVGDTAT